MRTESEKIEEELRQLRMQYTIMSDIAFSQYVITPKFTQQFIQIPKTVCIECSNDYRITHWCDSLEQQLWLPNWEKLIRAPYESQMQKPGVEQEKQIQEEHLRDLQHELKLNIELTKEQLKNENLQQKLEFTNRKDHVKINPSNYNNSKELKLDTNVFLSPQMTVLYEKLRFWRNSQAREEKVRPFDISNNSALQAIVYYKVSTVSELMRISGFSKEKAEKYGLAIFRILNPTARVTSTPTHQSSHQSSQQSKKKTNSFSWNIKKNPLLQIYVVLIVVGVFLFILLR